MQVIISLGTHISFTCIGAQYITLGEMQLHRKTQRLRTMLPCFLVYDIFNVPLHLPSLAMMVQVGGFALVDAVVERARKITVKGDIRYLGGSGSMYAA